MRHDQEMTFMRGDQLISALCYFSVIFAPIVFPIIILLLSSGEVKYHATRALWTHLVPYLCFFLGVFILSLNIIEGLVSVLMIVVLIAVGVWYFVLNFIRGMKVLQ